MNMKLADKYLYYPFIRIPESTLVHSLLYNDRIKRIIPPNREMDVQQSRQARFPNEICRQYLGYEFIESADYWDAKDKIADLFCSFLDESYNTKNPQHFEPLLGKNYKKNLVLRKSSIVFGTQYFVYAAKFSPKVFDKLESFSWMRYDKDRMACELRNEICNIYMSLLAACISKLTKEPISTGLRQADDILRSSLFLEYFAEVIPSHMQQNEDTIELCINLLMGEPDTESSSKQKTVPLHDLLTFPEAVRIRCGLENERRDFCTLIDDITEKAKAIDPSDPDAFITLEVKDVLENANDYLSRIKTEAINLVSEERKNLVSHVQSGLSAVFPALGLTADIFTGLSPAPGVWSLGGTVLGLGTFFIPRMVSTRNRNNEQQMLTSRQKAYVFMNRLWDIRDARIDQRVEQIT
jgi:hypothetical protein